MFCPNCGKVLREGAKFCTECGNPITVRPAESAPQPQAFQAPPQTPVEPQPQAFQAPPQAPVEPQTLETAPKRKTVLRDGRGKYILKRLIFCAIAIAAGIVLSVLFANLLPKGMNGSSRPLGEFIQRI